MARLAVAVHGRAVGQVGDGRPELVGTRAPIASRASPVGRTEPEAGAGRVVRKMPTAPISIATFDQSPTGPENPFDAGDVGALKGRGAGQGRVGRRDAGPGRIGVVEERLSDPRGELGPPTAGA